MLLPSQMHLVDEHSLEVERVAVDVEAHSDWDKVMAVAVGSDRHIQAGWAVSGRHDNWLTVVA